MLDLRQVRSQVRTISSLFWPKTKLTRSGIFHLSFYYALHEISYKYPNFCHHDNKGPSETCWKLEWQIGRPQKPCYVLKSENYVLCKLSYHQYSS